MFFQKVPESDFWIEFSSSKLIQIFLNFSPMKTNSLQAYFLIKSFLDQEFELMQINSRK